jgi:hypothetical protein
MINPGETQTYRSNAEDTELAENAELGLLLLAQLLMPLDKKSQTDKVDISPSGSQRKVSIIFFDCALSSDP